MIRQATDGGPKEWASSSSFPFFPFDSFEIEARKSRPTFHSQFPCKCACAAWTTVLAVTSDGMKYPEPAVSIQQGDISHHHTSPLQRGRLRENPQPTAMIIKLGRRRYS